MKLLKDEHQNELRQLLERLIQDGYQADEADLSDVAYWANWLKPKRTRKKKEVDTPPVTD